MINSSVLFLPCAVTVVSHASCAVEVECFSAANCYSFWVWIVLHFLHLLTQALMQLYFLNFKNFVNVTILIVGTEYYRIDECRKVGYFCSHHFHKVLAVLFEWFVLHLVSNSKINDPMDVLGHLKFSFKESVSCDFVPLVNEFTNTSTIDRIFHELAK